LAPTELINELRSSRVVVVEALDNLIAARHVLWLLGFVLLLIAIARKTLAKSKS
jgi:hypothetical protein